MMCFAEWLQLITYLYSDQGRVNLQPTAWQPGTSLDVL